MRIKTPNESKERKLLSEREKSWARVFYPRYNLNVYAVRAILCFLLEFFATILRIFYARIQCTWHL